MAVSTSSSSAPVSGPQFLVSGGPKIPSVQLTLEHNALPVQPARHSDSSRDLLKRVQKEDTDGSKKKRGRSRKTPGSRDLSSADKVLLQKGIILTERPRQSSLPLIRPSSPMPSLLEFSQGALNLSTAERRTVSTSPQAAKPVSVYDLVTGAEADHPLNTFLNLATGSNSPSEQFDQLNRLNLVEVASSPDSGYGNTPDTGLHTLSPNSRSRSVSSETSGTMEDVSMRRTSPSSGLWSGHESTLEYVMEEETFRERSKEEGEEKRESSDEGSASDNHDHSSSPCEHSPDDTLTPELSSTPETSAPEQLASVEPGSNYFHPQDDVLIHTTPRRLQRTGLGYSTLLGSRSREQVSDQGKKGRPRANTSIDSKGENMQLRLAFQ